MVFLFLYLSSCSAGGLWSFAGGKGPQFDWSTFVFYHPLSNIYLGLKASWPVNDSFYLSFSPLLWSLLCGRGIVPSSFNCSLCLTLLVVRYFKGPISVSFSFHRPFLFICSPTSAQNSHWNLKPSFFQECFQPVPCFMQLHTFTFESSTSRAADGRPVLSSREWW